MSVEFVQLVNQCSKALWKAYQDAAIDGAVIPKVKVTWRQPAIFNDSNLFGIQLKELPRMIYDTGPELDPQKFLSLWGNWVQLIARDHPDAVDLIINDATKLFPDLPYNRKGSGLTLLLQTMCAASWTNSFILYPTATRTILRSKVGNVELSKRYAAWPGGMIALPNKVSHTKLLKTQVGSKVAGSKQTQRLYARLVRYLPMQRAAIDLLFAAVVLNGPEYEELLGPRALFFSGLSEFTEDVEINWTDLELLVEITEKNPVRFLGHKLLRALGRETFSSLFGYAQERLDNSKYQERTRLKHRLALKKARLKLDPVKPRQYYKEEKIPLETLRLMELQGRLG